MKDNLLRGESTKGGGNPLNLKNAKSDRHRVVSVSSCHGKVFESRRSSKKKQNFGACPIISLDVAHSAKRQNIEFRLSSFSRVRQLRQAFAFALLTRSPVKAETKTRTHLGKTQRSLFLPRKLCQTFPTLWIPQDRFSVAPWTCCTRRIRRRGRSGASASTWWRA